MAFAIDNNAHHARRQKQIFIQRDNRRSQYRETRTALRGEDDTQVPQYVSFNADNAISTKILQDIPLHESDLELRDRMYSRMRMEIESNCSTYPDWLHHTELSLCIPPTIKTAEGRALRHVVMDVVDILQDEIADNRNQGFLPPYAMQYEDEAWFGNTFPDMQ